jgi:hypothetical protein
MQPLAIRAGAFNWSERLSRAVVYPGACAARTSTVEIAVIFMLPVFQAIASQGKRRCIAMADGAGIGGKTGVTAQRESASQHRSGCRPQQESECVPGCFFHLENERRLYKISLL